MAPMRWAAWSTLSPKIGQKWHGSVTVDSTIQEHRDRGDTYNGQFFTSGPLIDGVLGMKAYGSGETRKRRAAEFRHHRYG